MRQKLKVYTAITTIFIGFLSHADIAVVQGQSVYKTFKNLKSELFSASFAAESTQELQYVSFSKKKPIVSGIATISYSAKSIVQMPAFEWLSKSKSIKLPQLDGCGQHPKEWLAESLEVAKLKKSIDKSEIYFQLPKGFKETPLKAELKTSIGAVVLGIPKDQVESLAPDLINACFKSGKAYKNDDKAFKDMELIYMTCSDSLNEIVFILKNEKNKSSIQEIARFAVTEECP